jgi:hypothetical protein
VKIFYSIQSANRPFNVERMNAALSGCEFFWFVPKSQLSEYKSSGAKNIIGVSGKIPMKSKQLNAALRYGYSRGYEYVATMDDDYNRSLLMLDPENKNAKRQISLPEAIDILSKELKDSKFFMAGMCFSTNPFFSPYVTKYYGLLTGQLNVHKKNKIFYDEDVRYGSVDLDMCIQQHITHGGVVKVNRVLCDFDMLGRTKSIVGGFENLRSAEKVSSTLAYLMKKYRNYSDYLKIDDKGAGTANHHKIKWAKLGEANGAQ